MTSRMISPSSSSGRCDTTSRWFPNPRSFVTFRPNPSPIAPTEAQTNEAQTSEAQTNEAQTNEAQTNEAPNASSFVGIAVAPWLRWAGLREKEDDLADHAAAPHLRKRWKCPACGVTMMAFYQEIDRHRERCGLPEEERDPAALPANFGKGGGSGPSLQEELAGGANLGLPREALSLRPPATKSRGRSETETERRSFDPRARQPVRRRERRAGGRYPLGADSVFRVREVREDARAHDGWDFEAQEVVPGVEEARVMLEWSKSRKPRAVNRLYVGRRRR